MAVREVRVAISRAPMDDSLPRYWSLILRSLRWRAMTLLGGRTETEDRRGRCQSRDKYFFMCLHNWEYNGQLEGPSFTLYSVISVKNEVETRPSILF
jgi:hypothetical protein